MPTTTTLSDGTYVQVSEPVDSQHVRVDHYSASGALLNEQAWDVAGASFDMPTITATTDAGYVIDLVNQSHATGVMRPRRSSCMRMGLSSSVVMP